MTRTPTEMELRVAWALLFNEAGDRPHTPWAALSDLFQAVMIRKARAAIRAMREPTKEMRRIGANGLVTPTRAGHAWQAMIDAASPPDSK